MSSAENFEAWSQARARRRGAGEWDIRLPDDPHRLLFREPILRIAPSDAGTRLSTYRWSENPRAGNPSVWKYFDAARSWTIGVLSRPATRVQRHADGLLTRHLPSKR
jgi:hypothetical protein